MNKTDLFEYAKDDEALFKKEKQWKIYVVDDDEGVLKTTKDTLEFYTYKDRGIEMYFFENAADVIRALSDDDPSNPDVAVILLDIVMKDYGFEVINYLRNRKENNITQIIIRTGQAGKTVQDQNQIAQEYDINDFIDKSENSYNRIHTAVTTSLRMFILLKSLSGFQKNIEIFNSSLMDFFNLKKEKTSFSKEDYQIIIHSIFNHLNYNIYKSKKNLSENALNKIIEAGALNIQILYVIINNTLKRSKSDTIQADDINPSSSESKLKWEKDESWLMKLHEALIGNKISDMEGSEKFISSDTPLHIFIDHHKGLIPVAPIQWIGNLCDLLYLYYALHRDHYITDGIWDIMHKELELHYCYKGSMINSDTLKTYKTKYKFTKNETTQDGKIIRTEEWLWDTPNKELIDEIIYNLED